MANFEVPENPEFTEGIRKLETTDPGHANIFNAVFEPIINNVLHLRKKITEHLTAKNPHNITKEDLGLAQVENKPMGELSTEFTVAGTRSNIQSGQAMKTILGMLSRWYTDLKTVAWSGKYNDLTDKPTIPNGAAASCAVANNDTTTAAGSVADARIVRQHGLEIDEINRDLGGCQFGITTDGLPGYKKAGADTVYPFKNDFKVTKVTRSWSRWSADLGNNFRYDGSLTEQPDYKNFVIEKNLFLGIVYGRQRQVGIGIGPSISYNSVNGSFSLTTNGNWEITSCIIYIIRLK